MKSFFIYKFYNLMRGSPFILCLNWLHFHQLFKLTISMEINLGQV